MSFVANLFSHPVQHSTVTFKSEGHEVTIDHFLPQTDTAVPAVIGLHGSGGVRGAFTDPARLLASNGFAVFVPHYFERTGTGWADDATIRREFPAWMTTISNAIAHAAAQREVDQSRIGLLGFSLGAYLALSVAAHDDRVKAVVEYFGGLPDEIANDLKRLPPVLILHGDADPVVPVAEAEKLSVVLSRLGVAHEKHIYRGAGHVFSGMALFDSAQRTLRFLQQHLR